VLVYGALLERENAGEGATTILQKGRMGHPLQGCERKRREEKNFTTGPITARRGGRIQGAKRSGNAKYLVPKTSRRRLKRLYSSKSRKKDHGDSEVRVLSNLSGNGGTQGDVNAAAERIKRGGGSAWKEPRQGDAGERQRRAPVAPTQQMERGYSRQDLEVRSRDK